MFHSRCTTAHCHCMHTPTDKFNWISQNGWHTIDYKLNWLRWLLYYTVLLLLLDRVFNQIIYSKTAQSACVFWVHQALTNDAALFWCINDDHRVMMMCRKRRVIGKPKTDTSIPINTRWITQFIFLLKNFQNINKFTIDWIVNQFLILHYHHHFALSAPCTLLLVIHTRVLLCHTLIYNFPFLVPTI